MAALLALDRAFMWFLHNIYGNFSNKRFNLNFLRAGMMIKKENLILCLLVVMIIALPVVAFPTLVRV